MPDIGHAQQQLQDVVYLKNGSVIRGVIIEQVPNRSIRIQTVDGNVFVYNFEDIQRITKEPRRGSAGASITREKNPFAAFTLSLLLTGAGQFYNGEVGKGLTQLGSVAAGIILIGSANYDDDTQLGIGSLMVLGGVLWSLIDAPISANRINRENSGQWPRYGHMMQLNTDKFALGLDPIITQESTGLRMKVHF